MSKFVKVRIAVAVDALENWNATGWKSKGMDEPASAEAMGIAADGVADGGARYWLEAYLEVPETKIVQADVVKV